MWPLVIIFALILVFILLIIVFYLIFWRPLPVLSQNCSNGTCPINQTCDKNICVEIICPGTQSCNGICFNNYCTSYTCMSGNDCPTGNACVSGLCIPVGQSCQTNQNCQNLSCMNSVCVQCLSDSNCPIGQGCFNQICRFPYDTEIHTGNITYISPAQTNNNITAPPGYLCSITNCGANGTDPIYCDTDTICPSTCPYCVNSVCRCTIGVNTEECATNADCASGVCNNNICIPSGGQCSMNYNNGACTGCCPVSNPYCVNGICSPTSLGAMCGSNNLPDNMCTTAQALGNTTAVTGISPDGMGFFCTNGVCKSRPGRLNELCTSGSCETGLNCLPVMTPTILEMRCLQT